MSRTRAIIIAAIVTLTFGSLALGIRTTMNRTDAGAVNAGVAEIFSPPATTGSSAAAVDQTTSPATSERRVDADDDDGGAYRVSDTGGRAHVEDD
jgi:hypothetical protein